MSELAGHLVGQLQVAMVAFAADVDDPVAAAELERGAEQAHVDDRPGAIAFALTGVEHSLSEVVSGRQRVGDEATLERAALLQRAVREIRIALRLDGSRTTIDLEMCREMAVLLKSSVGGAATGPTD